MLKGLSHPKLEVHLLGQILFAEGPRGYGRGEGLHVSLIISEGIER